MGEVFYKELIPHPGSEEKWNDISYNAGIVQECEAEEKSVAGTVQSTLQEIKLPDCSGSYTYLDSNNPASPCSNRFIYWRVSNDVLELAEQSLDRNLQGNLLRLRFLQNPVLGGVTVVEAGPAVVVLAATVSSLHRLIFPHPTRLRPTDLSILHSPPNLRDHSSDHLMTDSSSLVTLPHTCCSWLAPDGTAMFVLAAGSQLHLFCMDPHSNKITSCELQHTSVISRLWSGFLPSVIRGSNNTEEIVSLVSHRFDQDDLIFALSKDLHLRLWCTTQTKECLLNSSVLEFCRSAPTANHSLSGHMLRKAIGSQSTEVYLAVYLNLPDENLFCILQVLQLNSKYSVNHISTIAGPGLDLVDFTLTFSQLWTLWLNGDSQPLVKLTSLQSGAHQGEAWRMVALCPQDVLSPLNSHLEPQEFYLRQIFHPGRFSRLTITKALCSYRRNGETSHLQDSLSLETLRAEVMAAVESQISLMAQRQELDYKEYLDLQLDQWDTFYSYCLQYHEVGVKALGIFVDPKTGLAVLIRKNMVSLLQPCDDVDSIILSSPAMGEPNFDSNHILREVARESLLGILESLEVLRRYLTEEAVARFQLELSWLRCPWDIAASTLQHLLTEESGEGLETELHALLATLQHFPNACLSLIRILDLTDSHGVAEELSYCGSSQQPLLGSELGLKALCQSLQTLAHQRFVFCRDLLLLQLLAARLADQLPWYQNCERFLKELRQKTGQMCQAYYVLEWSASCPALSVEPSVVEVSQHQLALLKLQGPPVTAVGSGGEGPETVLQLFLRDWGSSLCNTWIPNLDSNHSKSWGRRFPQLQQGLTHILWPQDPSFTFLRFLFSQCQYLQLLEYLRLLESTTEQAPLSRKFLAAACHLNLGESHKAVALFCEAAPGALTEPFLRDHVAGSADDPVSLYFIKVKELLEYYNLPDCVITICKHHLSTLSPTSRHYIRFNTGVFFSHLELEHYEEAFNCLMGNECRSRKDCLVKLVATMYERKQLSQLVQFKYLDLEPEFVGILESHTRSQDPLSAVFCEILFSYYVANFNYRAAATVVYTQALRLADGPQSPESLAKQVRCLLAAINCLSVVDPNHQWLKRPSSNQTVQVVDLEGLRKELALARARQTLIQLAPTPHGVALGPLAPSELVALLLPAGLFDTALEVAPLCNLPLTPVFEAILLKCLQMLRGEDRSSRSWDWLRLNELSHLPTGGEPSEKLAWQFLEHRLRYKEAPSQTTFHRCVVSKLLAFHRPHLPLWLRLSYQQRNPAELLLLYLQYGYLDKATELAMGYLDAVMGRERKEMYGLKSCLQINSPPVWVPYTYLESLLEQLEEGSADSPNREMKGKLERKLEDYLQLLECISQQHLHYRNTL